MPVIPSNILTTRGIENLVTLPGVETEPTGDDIEPFQVAAKPALSDAHWSLWGVRG